MRVAWVSLLGCAGSAWGREIPVYREYTHPVQFYDERGAILPADALGPDQQALRSLKESRAQDSLLGKELLLNLGLESGDSVFSPAGSRAARPASGFRGGEEPRRRQKKSSGKNWLAESISLPSLGQTQSNAAAATISAGAPESSWGWLAAEVAGQPEGAPALPEEILSEGEYNPLVAQEAVLSESEQMNPYSSASAASLKKEESNAFAPAGEFSIAEASAQAPEGAEAPPREWAGRKPDASSAMKGYAAPSGVGEMSQTRAMISEWTVGARPDFSVSVMTGSRDLSSLGNRANPSGFSRPTTDFSYRATERGTRVGWGGGSSMGSGMRSPSFGSSSWKGGWSANQAETRASSRFQTLATPMPATVIPASTYKPPKPIGSSGGSKPAWY